MAAAPRASATTFFFTGEIVNFVVPVAGAYQILAFGAQGGNSAAKDYPGGAGAEIRGDFILSKGEVLQIAVGGYGGSSTGGGGGGGGGSFVIGPGNKPLVIAGGGGGAGNFAYTPGQYGYHGQAG
jgi:hypothetical protein